MSTSQPTLPLISCILPTANRRRFVPQAIRLFLAQDYPNKELVILDDGAESAADLVPDDPQVRAGALHLAERQAYPGQEAQRVRRGQPRRPDHALGRRRLARPRGGAAPPGCSSA